MRVAVLNSATMTNVCMVVAKMRMRPKVVVHLYIVSVEVSAYCLFECSVNALYIYGCMSVLYIFM